MCFSTTIYVGRWIEAIFGRRNRCEVGNAVKGVNVERHTHHRQAVNFSGFIDFLLHGALLMDTAAVKWIGLPPH